MLSISKNTWWNQWYHHSTQEIITTSRSSNQWPYITTGLLLQEGTVNLCQVSYTQYCLLSNAFVDTVWIYFASKTSYSGACAVEQASKHAGPPAYIRLPLFFLYQILENNKKGKGADALRL